ncbi:MAG: hypothetical protein HKN75_04350 [Bacteroidia bacterium]|nr:hypothetical protein [Bacteroidia bacterium]
MPRSKALLFNYEGVRDFRFTMKSENSGIPDNQSEVRQNRRIKFKFKVPLFHKPNYKVLVGFKYYEEKFNFDDFSAGYHPIETELEDKSLKSIGGAVYIIKPFMGNKYLVGKVKADISGDYNENVHVNDYLKVSVSGLYGIKSTISKSYGFGFSAGYNFGRPSIYPLVAYNKTFSSKWGVESLLPSHIKLRHNISDKDILYLGTELHGNSFNLFFNDSTLSEIASPVYLQQSEIRFFGTYEREIHDFLWFNISAGLRENLEFTLSSNNSFKNDPFVDNDLGSSLFINASIFMVVPRKYIQ